MRLQLQLRLMTVPLARHDSGTRLGRLLAVVVVVASHLDSSPRRADGE